MGAEGGGPQSRGVLISQQRPPYVAVDATQGAYCLAPAGGDRAVEGILERVNKLINMGNVRTHLRNLMPVLGKATADALGLNVPLANTKLEWWPREDDRQLWSLRVQLPYEMRRKVDNRTQVDAVARPVTVSLPGLFCQRDKVNTDIRLEHLVVMLQMEEAARVAFEVYLSKSKPKALCGGRRHKAPSLASMGALRAAPRVVASAAELAAR
eukprot:TRINITY_DN1772_c0_g1_i4.p1 TRINITY_DN1772_c0_g1~~TRINITY_DN1772_c0_g1_i4.p1  ORF type:complete len:211 (+),score=32.45 TRINITY_DN1772_c0_g1_i4:1331-1963(+)